MQPTPTRSPAFTPDTWAPTAETRDRKSTRLNSSHLVISYAVFCLKKKKQDRRQVTSVQHMWPYDSRMPILVRYTRDAVLRSGCSWPISANGEPLKATTCMACCCSP